MAIWKAMADQTASPDTAATAEGSFSSILDTVLEWVTTRGLDFLVNALTALLIFYIGRWVAGWISRMVSRSLSKANVDATLATFLSRIAYGLLLVLVVIAALGRLGIHTTSFVAIIGAAGLAIGLAMQGSLSNFAAGVLIIIFRPFKIGDFIDAGGVKGIVEEISIFTTNLRTPDNLGVVVPNSAITGGSITNFAAKDTRRVDMTFGISYDDDIATAKRVIWEVLNGDERILKDPAPIVGVMELADSSVNLVVWPWVKRTDFLTVKFDLNERIKAALEGAGCSIPYPQRDVHLHTVGSKSA